MTRGQVRLAVGAAVVALLVGCSGVGARRAQPPSAPEQAAGGVGAARGFRSVRDYQGTPVPVRIVIPRIGVASALDRLGRAPDGTVQEPRRWEVAGWYALGARPGDPGSAVILGHVDSKGARRCSFGCASSAAATRSRSGALTDRWCGSWSSGPSSIPSGGSRPRRCTAPR